jgi:hypothetical protein
VQRLRPMAASRSVSIADLEENTMADDLDRACAQVGRFLHHFALLEKEIDQALGKLLKFAPLLQI